MYSEAQAKLLSEIKTLTEELLAVKALNAFNSALASGYRLYGEHGGSLGLAKNGWQEQCPSQECWHFTHADFPGGEVRWFNVPVWHHYSPAVL